MQNVTKELLRELIEETDARTIRQFLIHTFNGLGGDAADRIIKESALGTRQSPGKLKPKEVEKLLEAMKNVNVCRRPVDGSAAVCQPRAAAVSAGGLRDHANVIGTNWRSYGLSQSRGCLPKGPVTVMVHMASVWVPFTSESKEAIASYPEIQKELRLACRRSAGSWACIVRRRLQGEAARRTAATSSCGIWAKSPRR